MKTILAVAALVAVTTAANADMHATHDAAVAVSGTEVSATAAVSGTAVKVEVKK